jgi:uncharacterized repeat protein (TIGR02543 family)
MKRGFLSFIIAVLAFGGCGNYFHDLVPPDDNKILSFTVPGQTGPSVISENTVSVPADEDTDLRSLVPAIIVSPQAALIPLTLEYIQTAFPSANVSSRAAGMYTRDDFADHLFDLIREDNNFNIPEITVPIDFSEPVGFLVIAGKGNIRRYTVTVDIVYTITYLDVGGAAFSGTHGTGYPTEHVYGRATNLVSPTKTGYTFGGWFIDSNGSGTALTTLAAKDYKENITLYAKWTPNSVGITISFADIVDQSPILENITLSVSGKAPYLAAETITLNNPGQYTVTEWYYKNERLSNASSVDLSASGTFNDILGIKLLTVEVVKDGKLYSADITITVVE